MLIRSDAEFVLNFRSDAPRVVSQGYKIRDPGIPDRRSSGAELNH